MIITTQMQNCPVRPKVDSDPNNYQQSQTKNKTQKENKSIKRMGRRCGRGGGAESRVWKIQGNRRWIGVQPSTAPSGGQHHAGLFFMCSHNTPPSWLKWVSALYQQLHACVTAFSCSSLEIMCKALSSNYKPSQLMLPICKAELNIIQVSN